MYAWSASNRSENENIRVVSNRAALTSSASLRSLRINVQPDPQASDPSHNHSPGPMSRIRCVAMHSQNTDNPRKVTPYARSSPSPRNLPTPSFDLTSLVRRPFPTSLCDLPRSAPPVYRREGLDHNAEQGDVPTSIQ